MGVVVRGRLESGNGASGGYGYGYGYNYAYSYEPSNESDAALSVPELIVGNGANGAAGTNGDHASAPARLTAPR